MATEYSSITPATAGLDGGDEWRSSPSRIVHTGGFVLATASAIVLSIFAATDGTTELWIPLSIYWPTAPYARPDTWTPAEPRRASQTWAIAMGYLSATYLICAMVFHMLMAFNILRCTEWIFEHTWNPLRWLLQGWAMTFLAIQIALMSGMTDLFILLLVIGMVFSEWSFYFLSDYNASSGGGGSGSIPKKLYIFRWLPWVFTWGSIMAYFLYGTLATESAPHWLYALVYTVLALDVFQALHHWFALHHIGYWSDYEWIETFHAVCLICRTQIPAWLIYLGTRAWF